MSSSEPLKCYGCGGYYEDDLMVDIEVTRDDEYYPSFIHVCLGCNNRSEDTDTDHPDSND